MTAPDFFTALYAAVQSVCDGEVDEAEVTHEVAEGSRVETLTVTFRRYDPEPADAT